MSFHATIIEAPDDANRAGEVARRAMAAVCSAAVKPCGACAGCKKSLLHPDITVIRADGAEIKVDQIRAARSQLWIRPNEAARRVLVVEGAETMNQNAQNALLAVLEQPPSDAVFILATQNSSALLPTVRSRCHVVRLGGEAREVSSSARAVCEALQKRDAAALCEAVGYMSKLKPEGLVRELYAVRAAFSEQNAYSAELCRALSLVDGGVSAAQVTAFLVAGVV